MFQQDKSLRVNQALETIISNLFLVGIEVDKIAVPSNVFEKLKKDTKRWDLIYWDYYPHPSSAVEEIYASYGEENYHHYKNADVDQLYYEFNSTVDVKRKNEIGNNIYYILKEDNACIFLWSLNDWYEFNSQETDGGIHVDAMNKIDGEAFFSEPHLWRPAK